MNDWPRKYTCKLTMDPNTVNNNLVLSEENRKVMRVKDSLFYPVHPERFDGYNLQVLCKESLTGRCYWEAQWSGTEAEISVSYKGIQRKGVRDCVFGRNQQSWNLICSDRSFIARHNNDDTAIYVRPDSNRTVGVFVNELSGSLSFYSVSETHKLTHLHTFNTTFTDTLLAGFTIYYSDSSVSLCHIK